MLCSELARKGFQLSFASHSKKVTERERWGHVFWFRPIRLCVDSSPTSKAGTLPPLRLSTLYFQERMSGFRKHALSELFYKNYSLLCLMCLLHLVLTEWKLKSAVSDENLALGLIIYFVQWKTCGLCTLVYRENTAWLMLSANMKQERVWGVEQRHLLLSSERRQTLCSKFIQEVAASCSQFLFPYKQWCSFNCIVSCKGF